MIKIIKNMAELTLLKPNKKYIWFEEWIARDFARWGPEYIQDIKCKRTSSGFTCLETRYDPKPVNIPF